MQKIGFTLASVGFWGLSQLFSVALAAQPTPTTPATPGTPPNVNNSPAIQRLLRMFSPEIQNTLNACWQQGKVNLAAGATANGLLTCADGSALPEVTYTNYVNTVSDLLAASSLVGFRAVLQSDPRITPEMVSVFLANPQSLVLIRDTVQTAIVQSELLPQNATESTSILTNEVVDRLVPTLRSPQQLATLLGSPEQYQQVVNSFCTPPGMSVEQAKTLVPGITSIQLYAICIQESGVTNEVLQMVR